MPYIYGILAILAVVLVLKLISIPLNIIKWIVVNGITGLVLLFIFNVIGGTIGLELELNLVNALVSGVFGLPGIIVLLLIK